ncbi:MAG TPA: hypothetical protein DGG94_14475 [Micromonosporaceae bacterium]|nr:hypothetical protein [Micromonosporaceae bacterium]HCU50978.1 hypothetical protein [Micromonosporaceae bacterium]
MQASPKVLAISWGEIEIEGVGTLKDAKLFPGGARAWNWSETGTRHSPGIQPADAEELIANGATAVVLSRGMELRLEVMAQTLELLHAKGITTHVLETREAVRLYNELAETQAVGALLHSTC